MSKSIITGIFCSCLVSSVALAANESMSTVAPSTSPHASVSLDDPVVNINQASVNILMTLHGLAEKKAEAIVAYREAHGEFSSVDDLVVVKGIGKKLLEKLKANNPNRIVSKVSHT